MIYEIVVLEREFWVVLKRCDLGVVLLKVKLKSYVYRYREAELRGLIYLDAELFLDQALYKLYSSLIINVIVISGCHIHSCVVCNKKYDVCYERSDSISQIRPKHLCWVFDG
jgi:hypothetical protein